MANMILLPQQRINLTSLLSNFPSPLPPRRKLVFHCELRSLQNGDAAFGIIGYAAWRHGANQAWTIGAKVEGSDIKPAGANETFPLDPYLAFGNIEIPLSHQSFEIKEQDRKEEAASKKFFDFVNKILEEKSRFADEFLVFSPKLYPNPHSDYAVTVESTGFSAVTNPSPPAPPSEG